MQRLRDVVEGAGFTIEALVDDGEEWVDVEGTRAHMLPDTVGPKDVAIRQLVCCPGLLASGSSSA